MKPLLLNANAENDTAIFVPSPLRRAFSPHRTAGFYLKRFLRFAQAQQPNFYGWLAAALFIQGCVMAPATVLCIVANGNAFGLYIPCVLAFALTEVSLLSFMPTKITIPVFFAGVLADVVVIALSFLLR